MSDSSRRLFHDAVYTTTFLFISECISFYKFSKIYVFILLLTDISVIYSLSYYEINCCKHLCISFVETCSNFSWEHKSEIAASYLRFKILPNFFHLMLWNFIFPQACLGVSVVLLSWHIVLYKFWHSSRWVVICHSHF